MYKDMLMNWNEAAVIVKKWDAMKNRASKLNMLYFVNAGIIGREKLAEKYLKNMHKQKNKNIAFMKKYNLSAYS